MSKTIFFADDDVKIQDVGGKAASLHELQDLNVPEWFVITPAAFAESTCDPNNFSSWKIGDKIKIELQKSLDVLSAGSGYFAVRSSAVDEDSKEFSFAGQLESFLGVPTKEVAEKVLAVWQSAYSERVKAYRLEHRLGQCIAPAVIVQKMIDAESAGVSFAVDPISGSWGQALVSSVWGLGNSLVDGEVDADTWHIDRNGSITRLQTGHKSFGHYLREGLAVKIAHDDSKAGKSSLDDMQAAEVAALARRCSARRGSPQDIEWAYENGSLYLLQSRPITSLGRVADPGGNINIWDNSNIAESYGGVTTPLTYSFARSIYEEVYRQFCKIMGVPGHVIKANEETYRGLLGLMNGRMYYNLINWYKLLACFPGFSLNRGFMEQMMGVQKELGEELLELIPRGHDKKLKNLCFLSMALIKMGFSHFFIAKQIERFYTRLNKALAQPKIPLSEMRADELVTTYRDLEEQLLLKWDAPLVNDFFAMIFFGILSKLCKTWCEDENGTLQNDLVGGSGQVISAEPAKKVSLLAAAISGDNDVIELFRTGSVARIIAYLRKHEKLHNQYKDYLEQFGDRCIDELKLESITLHENPLPLLRAIGHFAGHNRKVDANHARNARLAAEKKVNDHLRKSRVKRMVFNFILKHARARVEDRENLRFERTRLFGRVRQIMVQLGKRFAALDVLDHASDIFYLEKDEILSYVSGFASCPDMRGIAGVRKRHFEEYKNMPPIADRFQTKGMVFVANDFSIPDEKKIVIDHGEGMRQGIGCCPGIVRGKVQVVRDPRGVELPAGSILVAERTDPGWIMLFPAASGLLVERGSLLSHSAIVARELGLPAVVSVPGITSWLKNGDEIEFDGSTGKVRLLKEASETNEKN
jgi:pyruvate,water dikinase